MFCWVCQEKIKIELLLLSTKSTVGNNRNCFKKLKTPTSGDIKINEQFGFIFKTKTIFLKFPTILKLLALKHTKKCLLMENNIKVAAAAPSTKKS